MCVTLICSRPWELHRPNFLGVFPSMVKVQRLTNWHCYRRVFFPCGMSRREKMPSMRRRWRLGCLVSCFSENVLARCWHPATSVMAWKWIPQNSSGAAGRVCLAFMGRQDIQGCNQATATLPTLSLFLYFGLLLSLSISLSLSESLNYGELSHLAHLGHQKIGCCVCCFGKWFVSSSQLWMTQRKAYLAHSIVNFPRPN